jgi:hypothetical protein
MTDEDLLYLCLVTKFLDSLEVQVVTSKRVILVHGRIHKKEIEHSKDTVFGGAAEKDDSLLLHDFNGLQHWENVSSNYCLGVCGTTRQIDFRFFSKELFTKFTETLLRVANNAYKSG